MEALVVRRFNANMSVYLYMLIFGPLKGLPLNAFENYAITCWKGLFMTGSHLN